MEISYKLSCVRRTVYREHIVRWEIRRWF